MSGRISLLIVALVVLTGHQPINSQAAGSHNGLELADKVMTGGGSLTEPITAFSDVVFAVIPLAWPNDCVSKSWLLDDRWLLQEKRT